MRELRLSATHPLYVWLCNMHTLEWAQVSTTLRWCRLALNQPSLASSKALLCILQEAPKSSGDRGDEQPSWSQNFLSEGHGEGQFSPQLQRKPQEEAGQGPSLEFAEPELQMFDYISQVCPAWTHRVYSAKLA